MMMMIIIIIVIIISVVFVVFVNEYIHNVVCLFVFLALQPIVVVFSQPGSGLFSLLVFEVSRSHTTTHHSR
jgi:hypothetical protein